MKATKTKRLTFTKFLIKYGQFAESRRHFYHRRIQERLSGLGFRVISIERFASHPVWELKLKATLDAQARLLLGKAYPARAISYAKASHLLEGRLKAEIASILRQLGRKGPSDDIVVVRHGAYFAVRFVWAVGTICRWQPPKVQAHPFQVSGVVQRWLKRQRN